MPNRTFWVRFSCITGGFGLAMVRILARPNESDMPPKRTKKVRSAIYHNQIEPMGFNGFLLVALLKPCLPGK